MTRLARDASQGGAKTITDALRFLPDREACEFIRHFSSEDESIDLEDAECVDLADDEDGDKWLHIAAGNNLPLSISALVARGLKIEETNSWGETPLAVAAFTGALGSIRELTALGAKIDAETGRHCYPLDIAVLEEHGEAAKALIDAGGDIDRALFVSMEEGSIGGARLAIDLGAGQRPSGLAIHFIRLPLNHEGPDQARLAKFLLEQDPSLATARFDLEFSRRLSDSGPQKAMPDLDATLLYEMARRGNSTLTRCLLEAGADPTWKNSSDQTAVDAADDAETRGILQAWLARRCAADVLRGHGLASAGPV